MQRGHGWRGSNGSSLGHIPTRDQGQEMVLASVFQCPQLVYGCCLAHELSLVEDPPSRLEFRREVTLCLLKSVAPRTHVGQSKITELPADVRYDGFDHKKQRFKQARCAVCKKIARFRYSKCLVRLHFDKGTECAIIYHTESK